MATKEQKLIKILRWPENRRTGLLPWFVILRRLLVYPFLFATICLFWLFTVIWYGGLYEANLFWDEYGFG